MISLFFLVVLFFCLFVAWYFVLDPSLLVCPIQIHTHAREEKSWMPYHVVGQGRHGPAQLGRDAGDDAKKELYQHDDEDICDPGT